MEEQEEFDDDGLALANDPIYCRGNISASTIIRLKFH